MQSLSKLVEEHKKIKIFKQTICIYFPSVIKNNKIALDKTRIKVYYNCKKILREKSFSTSEKGVNTMEKEEKTTDKIENKTNNVSNFGVTLLITVLGVAIGFAVLLCMQ